MQRAVDAIYHTPPGSALARSDSKVIVVLQRMKLFCPGNSWSDPIFLILITPMLLVLTYYRPQRDEIIYILFMGFSTLITIISLSTVGVLVLILVQINDPFPDEDSVSHPIAFKWLIMTNNTKRSKVVKKVLFKRHHENVSPVKVLMALMLQRLKH